MKVIIAIDSLKGCLTSMEAGTAIKEGILKAKSDADIVIKPLADGGEGTTDALFEGLGTQLRHLLQCRTRGEHAILLAVCHDIFCHGGIDTRHLLQ